MSRSASRRSRRAESRRPADVEPRGRWWTIVALTAYAVALVVAFLIPFAQSGNPYPEGTGIYWAAGTALIAAAGLAGRASLFHRHTLSALRVSPALLSLGLFVLTVVLCSVIAREVFGGGANTADEIAQLWHAKILLSGHWSLPADPNPEFFAMETVVDRGRWYSQFPIGGAIVGIPGVLTGVPWMTNAILAGFSTVLIYRFARKAYGDGVGQISALLFALAPMVLFMAATWMNHVPVLFLAVVSLALLAEWNSATAPRAIWLSAAGLGLAIGFMATIRPLDAVVVAVVVGGFQLWRCAGDRSRAPSIAGQCIAGVIAVAPLLYANAVTTGSATRFGYEALWGTAHRIGFHVDPHGVPHTVSRGVEYMITYLTELNVYLLAWPLPAIGILVAALFLLWRRANRWDAVLLALFGLQLLAYAAYWYDGEFLGPRFLYTALPALIILIARGLTLWSERLGDPSRWPIFVAIAAFIVFAWCVPGIPQNALGLATQARNARASLKQDLAHAVQDAGIHNALVFVREPFTNRLARRLWGVGFSRPVAARMLETLNPCSLFIATRAVERDSLRLSGDSVSVLARATDSITRGRRAPGPGVAPDPATAACLAELDTDQRLGAASFGSALLLERIDGQGRIAGDVIYVADLGDHNEALRERFRDRTWYRVQAGRGPDGQTVTVVRPY